MYMYKGQYFEHKERTLQFHVFQETFIDAFTASALQSFVYTMHD